MEVTIEPIRREHAAQTWALRNQPGLWEYAPCDTPLPATLQSEEDSYVYWSFNQSCRKFAVLADGAVVGAVSLKQVSNGEAALSYYILKKELWGYGIATKAARQLLQYGFFGMKLDMVYMWIRAENAASLSIAKKLGFICTGKSLTRNNLYRFELTKTLWHKRNT